MTFYYSTFLYYNIIYYEVMVYLTFIVGHLGCFHFVPIINKFQVVVVVVVFKEREMVGMLLGLSVYLFLFKDLEQMG